MSTNTRIIGSEVINEDRGVFMNSLCKCLDYLALEAEEQGVADVALRLRQESAAIHELLVKTSHKFTSGGY